MDYSGPTTTAAAKSALGKKGKKAAATAAAWALLQSAVSKNPKSKAPLHPGASFTKKYGKGFAH